MYKVCLILSISLLSGLEGSTQPFNYLHRYHDSTDDGAFNILLRSDNTLFVSGSCYEPVSDNWAIADAAWMNVSANGANVLSRHHLHMDGLAMWNTYAGDAKQLPNAGYALTYTVQPVLYPWPEPNRWIESAGLVMLNFQLDTLFSKLFTDTALYGERLFDCDVLPSGDLVLAGWQHSSHTPLPNPPLNPMLIRVSPTGTVVWKHTYAATDHGSYFVSVQPLDNDRTLIGGCSIDSVPIGVNYYYCNRPWFVVINNSDGSIIKDTLFTTGYNSWGPIYKDVNGGYYHTGRKDSLASSNTSDPANFPEYIAHLDTNFNVTWITSFPYSYQFHTKSTSRSHQLQNGDILICGNGNGGNISKGWAARVNSGGAILWSKYYQTDFWNFGTFSDFVERPDGSIVFCGRAKNDSIGPWESVEVWIVATDANGDVLSENTFVSNKGTRSITIDIYPNPTKGTFNLHTPESGVAGLYDMSGRRLVSYAVMQGKTIIALPKGIPPGNYLLQFTGDKSGLMAGKRLVIE